MGDTETAARRRKRRKRQRRRAAWRKSLDWRGRPLTIGAWYYVVLATGYGFAYGSIATDHGTGHAGFPYAAVGVALGLCWGAATTAMLPPIFAGLATVASLFVAIFTLGPTYPGALSAALVAVVAGWLLGIGIRHLQVGRQRPLPAERLVDRSKPRRPAPIRPAERTQLLFTGIGGCLVIGVLAVTYLIPRPEILGTWLIALGIAALWGGPLGWWTAMTRSYYASLTATITAVSWGMLFDAWAASAFGATGLVLLGSMASISIGFTLRRLLEVIRGRHPRARAETAAPATPGSR